jgi:hypothetical protein
MILDIKGYEITIDKNELKNLKIIIKDFLEKLNLKKLDDLENNFSKFPKFIINKKFSKIDSIEEMLRGDDSYIKIKFSSLYYFNNGIY